MIDDRQTFFVGLNTGFVTDGIPDDRQIEFYRSRSSFAIHCVIVGNVVIPGGHGTNDSSPTISNARNWSRLTEAISSSGSIPGIQLSTTWEKYYGPRNFQSRSKREAIETLRRIVEKLSQKSINTVLNNLNIASNLSVQVGFRHLQVHAAHGYFFNLLLDERINKNAIEIQSWLEEWVSRYAEIGIETSIRFSLRSGEPDFDSDGRLTFLGQMSKLPFDYKDLSSGFYGIDKRLIYPGRKEIIDCRRADTIALALRFPNESFIFSGRALSTPYADLPPNVHIGLCRDLIANPEFLVDQSRGCTNAGKCHYFSRGMTHLTCEHWNK